MLKLISNFQDYYDSAIGCFPDSDVTIFRKTKEYHRADLKNMIPESVIDTGDSKYRYDWYWHESHTYGDWPIELIGFCGQWYYRISEYAEDKLGYRSIVHRYVSFDEVAKNSSQERIWSYITGKPEQVTIVDLNKDEYFTNEIFEKFGPIIYIPEMNLRALNPKSPFWYNKNADFQIIANPKLKDLGFASVKDPYTAMNELEHWIDVHARPDEAIVPVGDDITRLQAYGFDKKTSFRKPKQEKH